MGRVDDGTWLGQKEHDFALGAETSAFPPIVRLAVFLSRLSVHLSLSPCPSLFVSVCVSLDLS